MTFGVYVVKLVSVPKSELSVAFSQGIDGVALGSASSSTPLVSSGSTSPMTSVSVLLVASIFSTRATTHRSGVSCDRTVEKIHRLPALQLRDDGEVIRVDSPHVGDAHRPEDYVSRHDRFQPPVSTTRLQLARCGDSSYGS